LAFWFEFGSNYSYLTVMRIQKLAGQAGGRVVWRPFLLGPIFRDFGWQTIGSFCKRVMWQNDDRLEDALEFALRASSCNA
jgi:2-hydroxychromene-2-carboxylate isomerase